MASGDTGEIGGTPTTPIRSMMSLEQTTTPTPTIIADEASKEGGSVVTVAPTTGQEQPVDGGQPSSTVVSTQSTLIQAPQLAVIPSSTMTPTVEDASATPSLFQQLPQNQITCAQPVVFQTPPPPNQMAGAQPVCNIPISRITRF
ncbi:unnamed protein product [Lactuca virosa]|uniref:Uncharacterized protein n=1 Tax=Lactuca virosa TaxID=75947 RepID=A0AAU9M6N2_9ASTR|nr:unnamed protein product [Lactuca virosa]